MGYVRQNRRWPPLVKFLVVLGLPLALACGDDPDAILPEEAGAVVSLAEPAASELLRTLVGRLTSAVEEGGAVHALRFCSNEALPLTRGVELGLEGGLGLKRTSFRVRNPANAPDEGDEDALLFFEERILLDGEAPANLVQRVSHSEYRYYRPLFVAEVCVRCHGEAESLEPDVRDALGQLYPEDLATGYSTGDFRGLVRVSVPAATVEGVPATGGLPR